MTEIIWDNEHYRELTKSWNQAMCSRFESVFSNLHKMEAITESDLSERVYKYSLDLMKGWYKEPSPTAGLSNAEFIAQINDLNELIRLAATMSVYGDMIVPDLVIKGLMEFGVDSMDAMVREIMRVDFEAAGKIPDVDETDYFSAFTILPGAPPEDKVTILDYDLTGEKRGLTAEEIDCAEEIDYSECESQAPQRVAASFLNLISNHSAAVYIPLIVEKFAATNNPDIYIQEALAHYLTEAGQKSPDWMMSWLTNTIENREDLRAHPVIYLVMSGIASAHHSGNTSNALALLIRSLEYMKNKADGVSCLAILGDQRAIPFLRAWLQNHQNQMDEETWHEFTAAIRNLGGKVDPADHPSRFH